MPEEEKSETSSSNKQKLKVVWLSLRKINIARIANLPYGAKRGFIERKDLLKIGQDLEILTKFGNFNKIWKFC